MLVLAMGGAFGFLPTAPTTTTCRMSTHSALDATRRDALVTFGALLLGTSQPAVAKDVDPKVKGTKQDPSYEACVSKCMYECTKPKGTEQKSRQECLPECKQTCATTKQQLMIGTPL